MRLFRTAPSSSSSRSPPPRPPPPASSATTASRPSTRTASSSSPRATCGRSASRAARPCASPATSATSRCPPSRPTARRSPSPATTTAPTEVYTMPLAGGTPRRRTFDGAEITFVGWTPDGKVLVGTDADSTLPQTRLVTLDISQAERRRRAPDRPAGPGRRRRLRRDRQDAVLHAPAVPGQPHQALQGRHRPEPLEIRRRRRRGRAPHRRLHRHEQEPDVVAGPRLLPLRPRRHDEPLVDEAGRLRPQTAHETRRLGRRVRVALRRPHRLPTRRRYSPFRHRFRAKIRSCRSRSTRTSTRSASTSSPSRWTT